MSFRSLLEQSINQEFMNNLKVEMEAERKMEIEELERLAKFLDEANKISMYSFKYKINKRKNVYMTIETFPRFYVRLECTASFKSNRVTVTALDKQGYEKGMQFDSKKMLETVDEFMEFIGIDMDNFRDSVRMKGF